MKNKFFFTILISFFIMFISCQNKSLNLQMNNLNIGDTIALSQIINKDCKKVMVVSNKNRKEIILNNCKAIKFSQKYESFDFIFLCTDENDFGYIYVINPYFGWLDSIKIQCNLEKDCFCDYRNVYIKRISEDEFTVFE